MNAIAVTIIALDPSEPMPKKIVGGTPVDIRIVAARTVLFENGLTRDDFLGIDEQGVPEWIDRSQIFRKEELINKKTHEKIVAHTG
jgi:hypothetical protein